MTEVDETTLRLLTVLNSVSSKHEFDNPDSIPSVRPAKLNKKKSTTRFEDSSESTGHTTSGSHSTDSAPAADQTISDANVMDLDDVNESTENTSDFHEWRFGPDARFLTPAIRKAVDDGQWSTDSKTYDGIGVALEDYLDIESVTHGPRGNAVVEKLKDASSKLGSNLSSSQKAAQKGLWDLINSYKDIFICQESLDFQKARRSTVSLHLLNHIQKIRRRVLKNNERIAHAPSNSPPEDVQDQGFSRPSVLILLPFRSFALRWLDSIVSHLSGIQVENNARFTAEFGLPPGAVDKITAAEPGLFPPDHVEMFKGNIDDDFRVGLKITRKSIKLFSEFYSSDIILASPFGLRRSIEKDGNPDFLSSVEILVIDQLDALAMQNWDHLLFIMSSMNHIPKESHETDFTRVKPWYLDGYSRFLRQSIMFSPYETPDMRSLYRSFSNVTGKVRTRSFTPPVSVPEGIKLAFTYFEAAHAQSEPDMRFHFFTNHLFPALQKSAVQSSRTLIFVPSYFDFVRVRHWLKTTAEVSLAILFEESSNSSISRARQAFFSGDKQFLLTTERFHFFRRYRIRGIRNIVFYAPPDHPHYYTEYLSFPFLDEGVDGSDVTCQVLYSKWDAMRLERIVGSEKVRDLIR